jgi:hypothetical protein
MIFYQRTVPFGLQPGPVLAALYSAVVVALIVLNATGTPAMFIVLNSARTPPSLRITRRL